MLSSNPASPRPAGRPAAADVLQAGAVVEVVTVEAGPAGGAAVVVPMRRLASAYVPEAA